MVINIPSKKNRPETRLTRSSLLLRRLQAALIGRGGKVPTYIEMEEWTGVAEGTIKDWFNNQGRATVEFFISLLERVPREEGNRIVESVCRCFPTLEDPRLRCDLTVSSQLKTICRQKNGIVFIYGGTGEARTFLVSALANVSLACNQRPFRVAGFDVHQPDWFVPVPGVKYLGNPLSPGSLGKVIRQEWPHLKAARGNLIILNGIWSALPEMQKEIRALAVRAPVIVADAAIPRRIQSKRTHAVPVSYICVSADSHNRTTFSVAISAE